MEKRTRKGILQKQLNQVNQLNIFSLKKIIFKIYSCEFLLWLNGLTIWLVSVEVLVQSLAQHIAVAVA